MKEQTDHKNGRRGETEKSEKRILRRKEKGTKMGRRKTKRPRTA